MNLGQLLGRQGRTKIGVTLTHDGQHGFAKHRTKSPVDAEHPVLVAVERDRLAMRLEIFARRLVASST